MTTSTIILGAIGGTEAFLLLLILLVIVFVFRIIKKRMSVEYKLNRAKNMYEDKLISESEYDLIKSRLIRKNKI